MKSGIVRYVSIVKRLFILFSVAAIPAAMVCFVLALSGFGIAFWISAPAVLVVWFVVYGLYAMRVSMGTVTEIQITDKVLHLVTKRKTFTYDAHDGCVSVKTYRNKFVGTFQTQGSRDSFIFYRRVLFSKYGDEQFTLAEIRMFYPEAEEYRRES